MKEEDRIKAGILFSPGDPELRAIKCRTHKLNIDYNNTYEDDVERRKEIIYDNLLFLLLLLLLLICHMNIH